MSKYVKSIVRDGNNLVVHDDECNETIIDICCQDDTPPGEKEIEDEEKPPDELENPRCLIANVGAYIFQVKFAEFLVAVDPVLAGLPPYALPFVASFVYANNWPTSIISPLTLLLGQWALQSRYTSIRMAVDSLPVASLAPQLREIIFCTLPTNNAFTGAVRGYVADQLAALVTDPEKAVSEFMRIVPIGWYQRELQSSINAYENPGDYDCSDIDCGGDEMDGCLSEHLWVHNVDADTAGWLSLTGHSTSEFPGLAEAFGGVARAINATRIDSPPDYWRGIPGGAGVNNPVGVWRSFGVPCTIARVSARGGTGTQNTQLASIYYKQEGDISWKFLASTLSPLNNKHNPGGTFPIVDYGKPTDGLPAIPNVVALSVIYQTGGGSEVISWLGVNYNGVFPALP